MRPTSWASVYEGLTVGYCLALTQFVVVGALGLVYLRRAERVYDPMAEKVVRVRWRRGRSWRRERRARGDGPMTFLAATNVEALVIFAIVLSITLVITYWASKRMTGADVFWAAGRSIRASRTASRSPATTCPRPRTSASPA